MPEDPIKPPPGYGPKTLGLTPPVGYKPKSPAEVSQGFEEAGKEAIPYLPRLAANALPFAGSFLGPEGTALGSVIHMALRNEFPGTFGKGPKEPLDFATEIGGDVVGQNLIPGALEKVLAKGARGTLASVLANKMVQKISPSVGEGVEGARLSALTKEGQTLAGPELAENINIRKVLDAGIKNGKVHDPEAMLKELNSPEHHFRISPESYQGIEELAKNAKLSGDTTDKVISYAKKRLVLGAAGAALGGSLGHIGEGAAGIVLTDAMLGHLMSNPQTAKLVVQAMRTPASAPQANMLQKMIVNSLKVAEVPATVRDE